MLSAVNPASHINKYVDKCKNFIIKALYISFYLMMRELEYPENNAKQ